jgi:hypothetical protein
MAQLSRMGIDGNFLVLQGVGMTQQVLIAQSPARKMNSFRDGR